MKAMILAAGRGERMRPLTDTIPKPLLEVGGKPLIVWHLESLARAGIHEIVINHAHLGAKIEALLERGEKYNVSIQYSGEPEALESAGGISNALPLLGDDPFIVINGDIFTDYDFTSLTQRLPQLIAHNLSAHLVLVDNPPHNSAGDFYLQEERVRLNGNTALTFTGIALYQPALFEGIARGTKAKLAPRLRERIASNEITGEHYKGRWMDIGTPERLYAINQELAQH